MPGSQYDRTDAGAVPRFGPRKECSLADLLTDSVDATLVIREGHFCNPCRRLLTLPQQVRKRLSHEKGIPTQE